MDSTKRYGLAVIAIAIIGFFVALFLLIPTVRLTGSTPANGAEEIDVENFVFESEFTRNLTSANVTFSPQIKGSTKIEGNKIIFTASESLSPLQVYKVLIEANAAFSAPYKREISFKASKFGPTKTDIPPEEYRD